MLIIIRLVISILPKFEKTNLILHELDSTRLNLTLRNILILFVCVCMLISFNRTLNLTAKKSFGTAEMHPAKPQFECRCFIVNIDFKVIQVKIDS